MLKQFGSVLKNTDPQLFNLIKKEAYRQHRGLELIASENITSKPVLECMGSILTNKYSEGLPHKRYYGGNKVIDEIEDLCISRALDTFSLKSDNWGVNVQPYSGSSANMAVYTGLLRPRDRIMGLDLPSGGHLTHGFYTSKKKVSATSLFFESMPYGLNNKGYIDYEELEMLANKFKPKLIICGYSAYSRDLEYEKFRKIADANGSYLLCDMSHYSGLVATGELDDPFKYSDVVTTTTHKTLRGPRAGMIFYRKELANNINNAVFPGLQGGPHNHQIAAIATQLGEVMKPEFKTYIQQVKKNAKVLAEQLMVYGYKISTNGTNNHMLIVDLRDKNITGDKVEKICDEVNISINKNSVVGDKSALKPGGIRLGTSSLTTRGFKEEDIIKVALLLDKLIKLSIVIDNKVGPRLEAFNLELTHNFELLHIKNEVIKLACQFK